MNFLFDTSLSSKGLSMPRTPRTQAVQGDLMPLHLKIVRNHPRKRLLAETSGDVEDGPAFLAQKVVMMPALDEFIAGRPTLDMDGNDLMGVHEGPQGPVNRSHAQAPPIALRDPQDIGGKQGPVALAENVLNDFLLDGPSLPVEHVPSGLSLPSPWLAHDPSPEPGM